MFKGQKSPFGTRNVSRKLNLRKTHTSGRKGYVVPEDSGRFNEELDKIAAPRPVKTRGGDIQS
jgi:hypothetical protein